MTTGTLLQCVLARCACLSGSRLPSEQNGPTHPVSPILPVERRSPLDNWALESRKQWLSLSRIPSTVRASAAAPDRPQNWCRDHHSGSECASNIDAAEISRPFPRSWVCPTADLLPGPPGNPAPCLPDTP